jgi:hypothetical protein
MPVSVALPWNQELTQRLCPAARRTAGSDKLLLPLATLCHISPYLWLSLLCCLDVSVLRHRPA